MSTDLTLSPERVTENDEFNVFRYEYDERRNTDGAVGGSGEAQGVNERIYASVSPRNLANL